MKLLNYKVTLQEVRCMPEGPDLRSVELAAHMTYAPNTAVWAAIGSEVDLRSLFRVAL